MTELDAARTRAGLVRDRLMAWLLDEALPTWWAFGIDHARGGFHERLGLRCEVLDDPRRTRVLARQVYVFALAGRIGFSGRWREAVEMGTDYFLRHAMLPDGTVRLTVEPDGRPRDDSFNLYDQAFALFALASAAPVVENRERVEAAAVRLRDHLVGRYKHPGAGFEESIPPSEPLKANPHMHLFEAFLAWRDAEGDATWSELADEIAELSLSRFMDADSGFLREFFAADWTPAPGEAGRIVEPGHQFEWSWLMTRWGTLRDRADALAAARRLADLGERFGVDAARGVAINELFDDGSVKDAAARLWPQTERIKAHAALAGIAGNDEARARHWSGAADAGQALLRYFEVDAPGLWLDRMQPDGSLVREPVMASSFYHIVCGIEELDRALRAG